MNSLPTLRQRLPRFDPWILLLFVLCLPALAPLFAPGYFYEAHDGRHSVFYQVMFDAALRDGALAPRWAMHHLQGYGYPTFVILAPLGFYITELFVMLGASFTTAARLAFATGVLGGAWGVYALVRYWIENGADAALRRGSATLQITGIVAVAAGVIYTYAPYRLLDIYVRGALNESLIFLWLPWLFLVFEHMLARGSTRGWQGRLALAAFVLAATWLTHSFAIFFVTPLLAGLILFRLGQFGVAREWRGLWQRLALAGAAGIAGVLLIAYFLLPLLDENRYLNQQVYTSAGYDYRNHFVQAGQFVSPFWGYGYSDDALGANDGMGFQVGIVAAVIALFALLLVQKARQRALMAFLLVATVIILLLMTPVAAPIWEALPILATIQFPWRLLLLATFTLSALAGLVLAEFAVAAGSYVTNLRTQLQSNESAGVLMIALLAMVATAAYADPYLQPVEVWREDGRAVYRFEEEFPDMITGTIWTDELFTTSPMSVDYADPAYHEDGGRNADLTRLSIVEGSGEVVSNHSAGSQFGGVVEMATPGVVRVNLLAFPGWVATVDGEEVAMHTAPPYGLLDLDVAAGEHAIEVRMGSTPARTLGAVISWMTVVALLLLAAWPAFRGVRSKSDPSVNSEV